MSSRELVTVVLRFVAALFIIALAAFTLSYLARDYCEGVARGFVRAFGYWGMALGTLLADGFHFPIPPQFYMLLAVASGASTARAFASIAGASLVAGYVGFRLSRRLANVEWIARAVRGPRLVFERLVKRYGYLAAVLASLLPLPYSVLCYLAGVNHLPARFFALLALFRIPKLMLFYYLVYIGWRP